tara:strand:- start:990 stop:1169 length:180 start_codon:yes stop_codon:yes gene_type:complete
METMLGCLQSLFSRRHGSATNWFCSVGANGEGMIVLGSDFEAFSDLVVVIMDEFRLDVL